MNLEDTLWILAFVATVYLLLKDPAGHVGGFGKTPMEHIDDSRRAHKTTLNAPLVVECARPDPENPNFYVFSYLKRRARISKLEYDDLTEYVKQEDKMYFVATFGLSMIHTEISGDLFLFELNRNFIKPLN